jgi:FkbM family methyltransferase
MFIFYNKKYGKNNMKKAIQIIYKNIAKLFFGTGIGKIKIISKINKYMITKLNPNFVIIDDIKYFLDKNDSLGLSITKIHEESETKLIKKEIHEGDYVIDVGAHIGYFTLIFSKIVGEKGKVFSFEAEPSNFEILKKNLKENNIKNVICENAIISDKIGKLKLFTSDSSTGNRLFSDNKNKFIEIESNTLDNYFEKEMKKIHFVKLDIQGSEPLAIRGMEKILKKNNSLKIMLEWWPNGIKKIGEDPESHLKSLEELGYQILEIDDKNEKITPTNIEELIKKYPNKEIEDINLICKK